MNELLHVPPSIGYLALFLLVAGESAGLPIPGETALSTASVLAARGQLELPVVIAISSLAAIVGDNVGYLAGRHGGRRLLLRPGFGATRRQRFLYESERFYQKRGGITVFVGRWLPILRFTAALLAGTNRMPWRRFLLWNALGGICWATSVGLLAYSIGSQASGAIEALGAVGIVALTLAAIGHLALRRLRSTADSPRKQNNAMPH
ncbi:MAG: DedA family protein [Solirubrobacteraceae bacterium]